MAVANREVTAIGDVEGWLCLAGWRLLPRPRHWHEVADAGDGTFVLAAIKSEAEIFRKRRSATCEEVCPFDQRFSDRYASHHATAAGDATATVQHHGPSQLARL